MATPDLTAGQVMDDAAALLNDVAKNTYGYTVQLPYLKIAIKELRKHFELNNIPASDLLSAILTVPTANTGVIGFAGTTPVLPADLVDIQEAWQTTSGLNNWIPLPRLQTLNVYMTGISFSTLDGYVWEDQKVKFQASRSVALDLKLQYVRELFTLPADQNSQLPIINGDIFLAARTAALVAQYVEQNKERSDDLNIQAGIGLDECLGIATKGRQAIVTRRRPFRAGYKSRSS